MSATKEGTSSLRRRTAEVTERHDVTLFEASPHVGGQFRLAMAVPGKEEFAETLRYYSRRMEVLNVDVRLSTRATVEDLRDFDEVVVATGVVPRVPAIEGVATTTGSGRRHPKVVSYAEVLDGSVVPGPRVAVMGAGGIGVDVSHFLTHPAGEAEDLETWLSHWGVADPALHAGGLGEKKPRTPAREVYLLQRKASAIGKGLAKTSGWAHRAVLKDSGVQMLPAVTYERVDEKLFRRVGISGVVFFDELLPPEAIDRALAELDVAAELAVAGWVRAPGRSSYGPPHPTFLLAGGCLLLVLVVPVVAVLRLRRGRATGAGGDRGRTRGSPAAPR